MAANVCANYATPHPTLSMIACGVERTPLSSFQLVLTVHYQMRERRSLSLLGAGTHHIYRLDRLQFFVLRL